MTDKPKIALVISSTRQHRWADKPAQWALRKMEQRGDMEPEQVDLRDFELPFFNERGSNAFLPSEDKRAVHWQKKVASFDGYVFLAAEYNRSITGALKNALDQDYVGWNRKPMGVIAYGALGGAFATDHLRSIAIELQMVPVRSGVHIGGSDFFRVGPRSPNSESMEVLDSVLGNSLKAMLDQVVWYANVLKAARMI